MRFFHFSDIVDGNLKSIMRLILALAAHFKPQSVKHSTQANNKSSRSSVAGLAQVSFRKPVVLWVQTNNKSSGSSVTGIAQVSFRKPVVFTIMGSNQQ